MATRTADLDPTETAPQPDWFALMEAEGAINSKVVDWGRSISLRKVSADGRTVNLIAISGSEKILSLMVEGDDALLTAAVVAILAALEGHRPWVTW